MTKNTTQVATGGGYLGISSENATLTTAISEVINELEAQQCPMNQTQLAIGFDATNAKYAVVAIVRR